MDDLARHLPLLSHLASSATLLGLFIGLWYRRQPRRHVPIMIACIAIDLANVLVIELNRGAIEQAINAVTQPEDKWVLQLHIAVSVLTVICYFVAIGSGIRLWRSGKGRRLHQLNAAVCVPARLVNYATSFFVM